MGQIVKTWIVAGEDEYGTWHAGLRFETEAMARRVYRKNRHSRLCRPILDGDTIWILEARNEQEAEMAMDALESKMEPWFGP